MADQQGSAAVTVKQEVKSEWTLEEAQQNKVNSIYFLEQRAQSGANGAGHAAVKGEHTSVEILPDRLQQGRQAATTYERKQVRASHARSCDSCGDLSRFSIGAIYWEEPYNGGQQAKLCNTCFNTKFPGFGARNFECKKVYGEHTRPCGTCKSCKPFTLHATFYEEPYDSGKQRKLCRTCFNAEFPGYASKCAPAFRWSWPSDFHGMDYCDDGVEGEYGGEYGEDYDEEGGYNEEGEYDDGDIGVHTDEEEEQEEEDGSGASGGEERSGSEEEHDCVGPFTPLLTQKFMKRPIEATQEEPDAEGPVSKRLRSG